MKKNGVSIERKYVSDKENKFLNTLCVLLTTDAEITFGRSEPRSYIGRDSSKLVLNLRNSYKFQQSNKLRCIKQENVRVFPLSSAVFQYGGFAAECTPAKHGGNDFYIRTRT